MGPLRGHITGHLAGRPRRPGKESKMPLIARTPSKRALEAAHHRVYDLDNAELIRDLAQALGRPTLARLTNTPDLKTVTRWSMGRNQPTGERLERLRHAGVVYYALLELGLTPTNAEQWFRGANPVLDFAMPVDVLSEGRYADVLNAVQSHASE
jgi:hypothetical protein